MKYFLRWKTTNRFLLGEWRLSNPDEWQYSNSDGMTSEQADECEAWLRRKKAFDIERIPLDAYSLYR